MMGLRMETSFLLHHRVRLLLTLKNILLWVLSGEGGGNGRVTVEGVTSLLR